MSEENVEVVRRTLELFNADEVDHLIDEYYAPDARYIDHRMVSWEPAEDREAIRALFLSIKGVGEVQREFELIEDCGDTLLLRGRIWGRAREEDGGGEFEFTDAELITIRDGLIRERHLYRDEEEARAWLAGQ